MAGDGYAEFCEYLPVERAIIAYKYISLHGRATASEIAEVLGVHLSNAYRLLDRISKEAGWYKDGVFYVMLPEP